MIYRIIVFLFPVGLLITGCAAAQHVEPAVPAATLLPSSTAPPAITSTFTPLPTLAVISTPVSLPAGSEVIFEESGDRKLSGTLYGEGETAIILANMSIGGEQQWAPFVAVVDKQKFTTVTFNYRNIDDVGQDIDLILARLKEDGFARLVCIGASLGTRACSNIAREPEMAGIVLIAGSVHHASVAEATYPKLFISGALDVWAFDIEMGYERAAEPKELVLFEENRAHGTDLFSSKDGEQFLSLLIDFVNELTAP
jgi:hypothetical protein